MEDYESRYWLRGGIQAMSYHSGYCAISNTTYRYILTSNGRKTTKQSTTDAYLCGSYTDVFFKWISGFYSW